MRGGQGEDAGRDGRRNQQRSSTPGRPRERELRRQRRERRSSGCPLITRTGRSRASPGRYRRLRRRFSWRTRRSSPRGESSKTFRGRTRSSLAIQSCWVRCGVVGCNVERGAGVLEENGRLMEAEGGDARRENEDKNFPFAPENNIPLIKLLSKLNVML